MTMDSDRMCCVRLSTNVGFIYVFNEYFPCDNSTQCNLQLYNEMLAVVSSFFIKHNVVNCIIGGDLNTDLSRARSGNTISLNNFILREMLSMAQQVHINNIQYTFKRFNQCSSIIDHFILSENMEMLIKEYYATDSIDNLSDHIPLYISLDCYIAEFTHDHNDAFKEKPNWNLATNNDIQLYKCKLNEILHQIDISSKMKHCDNCNNLCLSTESISQMYDKVIDACSDATRLHVPISGKHSPKVIPGWDNDMTAARNSSMFWHDIWVSCNKPESGCVYAIMKKNRNVYHYKLRGLKKLRNLRLNCQYLEV